MRNRCMREVRAMRNNPHISSHENCPHTQRHIYTKWQFTILRRQKNNVRIMTINPLINEMN